MKPVKLPRVVLGVSGGVAAYKSPDLCRRLREHEVDVRVVMTPAAEAFITPLTLQAVSGRPVHTRLLDERAEAGMGHIELARWADLVLVAPATADLIARLAAGLADDLLTTLALAASAPLVLAPAMNQQMWRAPATSHNVRILRERGVRLLGPADGDQACGDVGPGRMLEPLQLVESVLALLSRARVLDGVPVLVTAGPTREAIDPVRFLSNHSSGKMGYSVAQAAAEAGARVTLVSGPTALDPPTGVERVQVESSDQMFEAVMRHVADSAIFVAAAAVADYRPEIAAGQKLKKLEARTTLTLARTRDILAHVAGLRPRPFTVGFAAETEALADNARAKLKGKRLDMIAANQVGMAGRGFNAERNALSVFWPGGERDLAMAPKLELARELVSLIAERYRAAHTA